MRKAVLHLKRSDPVMRTIMERVGAGKMDFSRLAEMSDDDVIEHLTQVKGVGVWTAHMFLMFTLRRPNILPTGDFGVRMAMHKHYLDKSTSKNGKRPVAKKGKAKARP